MQVSSVFAEDLTLGWGVTDSSVDHYEVFWGSSSGSYSNSMTVESPPATLTGLSVGRKYYMAIRACTANNSGCSGYSNEIVATTNAPISEPPPGPNVES